jgi:TolB-like protein/class 3 adenylate cyclase
MNPSRQLAAIMFADIEGYTMLMQEDEQRAREMRDKFQHVVESETAAHSGRIVQFSGDGVLALFNSAIEAVRAAIAVQLQMQQLPRVPLRIGLHSGDVGLDDTSVYGDGVNIASRIESFAVAGSIFVSGKVYDEIKNQKDIHAVSLGKFQLKNVKELQDIFAISNTGLTVPGRGILKGKGKLASAKKMRWKEIILSVAAVLFLVLTFVLFRDKFSSANKVESDELKTIAVLPFTNLSSSIDDEYFTDGICDEILTQISKIGELNVMSRTSVLQYKNTTKNMKVIGNELGVDVLLEGTVQKTNDKVRIHAQLINAKNDQHLWAETYDRELKDIFSIQTEIAKKIAVALNARLTAKERNLFEEKRTSSLQAYDFFLRGNDAFSAAWEYGKVDEVPRAVRMYEQSIKIDSQFTAPYEALIKLYLNLSWANGDKYHDEAKKWLDKLRNLKKDDVYTHNAMAIYLNNGERDYAGALAELDKVDKMTGNAKITYDLRAEILRSMGKIDESLEYIKKQAALFPRSPRFIASVAETFKLKRNFDSSLYYINKAIDINPDVSGLYMRKSMYYAELKGDVATASSILRNAAELVDTSQFASDFTYFEILKGNYDLVIQRTINDLDNTGLFMQYKLVPNALAVALMYHLQRKDEEAKVYFQKAYDVTTKLMNEYPDDFRLHGALGVALAGLGQKDKAVKEGLRGRDLMPVTKDAIMGISPLENLALIYTLLGEEDQAVTILEQMLNMPFAWTMSNSVALYKIHYYWKPLQNDPKFQAMIRKYSESELL